MVIPEISDPVYQVNVAIITTFQTTGLELNFLRLDSSVVPSVKNFQDQLNSNRFAVFPGGNSILCNFPEELKISGDFQDFQKL